MLGLRVFRFVVIVTLAVLPCSMRALTAGKKIRLKVLRLPTRPAVGPWQKAFLEAFEQYIREHPEVEIRAAAGITPPEGMGTAGELTAIAAGTAADVFDTALARVRYYAEQGFLRPLDDLLEDDLRRDPDFIRKRYIPEDVWNACFYNGRCYAIPWYYGNMSGFIYRRDLMRRSGISPPRPPADWDELLYFAMKCTYPEKGQYGMHIRIGHNAAYEFGFFLNAAGGRLIHKVKTCSKDAAEIVSDWNASIDKCPRCGADLRGVPSGWRLSYASAAGVRALRLIKRLRWCRWVRSRRGEPFELPYVIDPDTGEPIYVTGPDRKEVTSPVTGKRYGVPRAKRVFVDPETGENLWPAKRYTGVVQLTPYGWNEFINGEHVMRFGGMSFFALESVSRICDNRRLRSSDQQQRQVQGQSACGLGPHQVHVRPLLGNCDEALRKGRVRPFHGRIETEAIRLHLLVRANGRGETTRGA